MRKLIMMTGAAATLLAPMAAATADLPPAATAGAYDDRVLAFIDTRPADASYRVPDNPGGWIETRTGDNDAGSAPVDTLTPISLVISFR